MDSVFDAETFMNSELEGANETKFTPIPEGEYTAYIDSISARTAGDDNNPMMEIIYTIVDTEVLIELDMDRVTAKQAIWPDLDENGKLLFGKNKNVRLGRLREAVSQNQDGQPWSPRMLEGTGPVKVKIVHDYNKAGEGPFANVSQVVAG